MLYNILLVVSLLTLFYVLSNVIRNKINIQYAMVWIVWAIGMIVISLFPEIVVTITSIIGIIVPSNTVFLIFIFLLYCLTFYVYLKLSRHNEDILNLNYELAVIKKKLEEIEKKSQNK